MTRASLHPITIGSLLLVGVAAPLLFPAYTNQIAVLWLMIVFAMTWDTLGGQMGYNSLGNIFFFGAGMYTCAVVQIGLYYDVGMYTSGARTTHIAFTTAQYFTGFAIGIVAAGIMAAVLAVATSWVVFGLRGPYFAIGTLGVAVAGLLGNTILTILYFIVLAPFAWLARRAERREPIGWVAIPRDRDDASSSQY